jgi:hypothetical protein
MSEAMTPKECWLDVFQCEIPDKILLDNQRLLVISTFEDLPQEATSHLEISGDGGSTIPAQCRTTRLSAHLSTLIHGKDWQK